MTINWEPGCEGIPLLDDLFWFPFGSEEGMPELRDMCRQGKVKCTRVELPTDISVRARRCCASVGGSQSHAEVAQQAAEWLLRQGYEPRAEQGYAGGRADLFVENIALAVECGHTQPRKIVSALYAAQRVLVASYGEPGWLFAATAPLERPMPTSGMSRYLDPVMEERPVGRVRQRMSKYMGRGWEKPYHDATGTFTDHDGHVWPVYRIQMAHRTTYMRWCIDGDDPGASFIDEDGAYTHGGVVDGLPTS